MAIKDTDIFCDNDREKSACRTYCSSPNCLLKRDLTMDNESAATSISSKVKKKSPYLNGDRIQLCSQVTGKRIIHKTIPSFVSSFSLAADVYKGNCDEFKLNKRSGKKNKKSILTLPNKLVVAPQEYTVSDPNDSGYFKTAAKDTFVDTKKRQFKNSNTLRSRNKVFEIYDRDAQYCSQLNTNLDYSLSDEIKGFGRKRMKTINKKNKTAQCKSGEENGAHNIWAILRKMNTFQFVPSPPDSENSTKKKKKSSSKKKYHNRRNSRYVESSSTKEFAYISNIDLNKTPTSIYSRTSSFDRVTIIEKPKRNDTFENSKDYNREQIYSRNVKMCNNNDYGDAKKVNHYRKRNTTGHQGIKHKNSKLMMPIKNAWQERCSENKSNKSSEDLIPSLKSSNQLTDITKEDDYSEELYRVKNFFNVNNDEDMIYSFGNRKEVHLNSPARSNCSIVGKTQLILNNVQNKHYPVRKNITSMKPQLITTMPSVIQMPKLTKTEIRRLIANIKFPLVILERDQLSSSVEVMNTDALQFDGLEEHIWPFMLDWSEDNDTEMFRKDHINRPSECNNKSICNMSADRKTIKLRVVNKISTNLVKESKLDVSISNIKKFPIKTSLRDSRLEDLKNKLNHYRKPKSIYQLKEEINAKNSPEDVIDYDDEIKYREDLEIIYSESNPNKDHAMKEHIDIDAGLDKKNKKFACNISNTAEKQHKCIPKYCRAKTKWVNEFIENVIFKIKGGVYFTEETKILHPEEIIESKTISRPVRKKCESTNTCEKSDAISKAFVGEPKGHEKNDCLEKIGFDDVVPAIEIKSLNMKQITIRHCVTDVAVQFDIAIRKDTSQMLVNVKKAPTNSYASVVPVDNQINLFKCPTAILNAVLPAELCTVLPNIMRMVINKIKPPKLSLLTNDKVSLLSTICEISRLANHGSLTPVTPTLDSKPSITGEFWSDFSNHLLKRDEATKKLKENIQLDLKGLLPNINLCLFFKSNIYQISYNINKKDGHFVSSNEDALPLPVKSECKELVRYTGLPGQFLNLKLGTLNRFDTVLSYIDMFRKICTMKNSIDVVQNMNNYPINLWPAKLFNNNMTNVKAFVIDEIKVSEKESRIATVKSESCPFKDVHQNGQSQAQTCSYYKSRKNFCKNKKSKSMTCLNRKRSNTVLSNITNMEAFCRVLGSGKTLCSVFNDSMERKILSTIKQMKKWITELSPKQALLILLLLNKKERPNLIRLRSVLLQGIAVNRITRAAELDLEVEVVEREQINQYPQCEGISYLPSSIENKDSLLEELYWIAKTTASDYQRPFDESSEKLLKALLEKRKQLNPSYLRVMARYVGLGLLKPLSKKNSSPRDKY